MGLSWRDLPWRLIALGIVFSSICLVYVVYLNEKVPLILKSLSHLRERRYDADVLAGVFGMMVLSVPLATVPTGAVLLSVCIVAYIYGFGGLSIAWSGFTLGLLTIFCISRTLRGPSSSAAKPLPECLSTLSTEVLINGVRRMLHESPKRTVALLTFSMHSPSLTFLFGWGTDLTISDVLPAAVLDGGKIVIPLLKGLALRDVLDAVQTTHDGKEQVDYKGLWVTVSVKLLIAFAICCMVFAVARSVQQELQELGEQDPEESRPLVGTGDDAKEIQDDGATPGAAGKVC